MKTKTVSPRQFDTLNVLWEAERPLLISEIVKLSEMSVTTVQFSIKALLKKGYVKKADIIQNRTVLAQTYSPAITREEYLENISEELQGQLGAKIPLAALVEKEEDWKVLDDIERIIEEKRKR